MTVMVVVKAVKTKDSGGGGGDSVGGTDTTEREQ